MNKIPIPQRIIEAAMPLFARYGFAKTSVDELARAAHLSKATLYAHFASKEALFAAVIRQEAALLHERVLQAVQCEQTHPARVRVFLRAHVHELRHLVNLHQISAAAFAEILPMVEQVACDVACEGRDHLTALLVEGIAAGQLAPTDPANVTLALDLLLSGIDLLLTDTSRFQDFDRELDRLIDIVVRGLVTDAPKEHP